MSAGPTISTRKASALGTERGAVTPSPTLLALARALAEVTARACFVEASPVPLAPPIHRDGQTP